MRSKLYLILIAAGIIRPILKLIYYSTPPKARTTVVTDGGLTNGPPKMNVHIKKSCAFYNKGAIKIELLMKTWNHGKSVRPSVQIVPTQTHTLIHYRTEVR